MQHKHVLSLTTMLRNYFVKNITEDFVKSECCGTHPSAVSSGLYIKQTINRKKSDSKHKWCTRAGGGGRKSRDALKLILLGCAGLRSRLGLFLLFE